MIPLSYGWSFWQLNQSRIFTFIFTNTTYTFSKSNKKHLSTPNLNNMYTFNFIILRLISIWCPNEPELWSSELRTQVLLWTQLVQWLQSAFCSLAFRHLEYRFEATKKIQIPKENSNCNLYTNIIINYIYSSKKG